jgi:hypothetical protein
MFPEITPLRIILDGLKARLAALRENPESGMTTEQIILIAVFAALAIAAGAIITTKVLAKAHSIQTQ